MVNSTSLLPVPSVVAAGVAVLVAVLPAVAQVEPVEQPLRQCLQFPVRLVQPLPAARAPACQGS